MLHHLLKKSAELYPQKTAIRYKGEQTSYEKLDLLTDQLASCLISRGVKAGDRVGIYMDKSAEAIVAIFGILKSGGCYVPLDHVCPIERLLLIINDCSIQYLITSSKEFSKIDYILQNKSPLRCLFIYDMSRDQCKKSFSGLDVIFKDEIQRSENTFSEQQIKHLTNNNLAYVLYTSGSTGQPKGVMISHKASLAFVDWAYKCFAVNSEDNISSHAPFHFDLSIFDIFVSVEAGATICIIPSGLSAFPKSLAEFIENEKISTWYSVPSVLIQLVLYGGLEQKDLSFLRRILFAGEVFPTKYLRKLIEIIPHARYYNLYGPTETNVITYHWLDSLPPSDITIPIGRPCDGVETFILDDSRNPVGEHEQGELYVSAPTLMSGYWNDSKKTESVLFDNPFSSDGGKIYKTGDLIRMNEQGYLEYHGRCDHMIKSRGYRIELGEIESVFSGHPDVKEVVVVGVPDEKIGKKIKAVLVLNEGSNVSKKQLELYCSKKVPQYMIPHIITFRDSLPRTSTNKIDREKLVTELM